MAGELGDKTTDRSSLVLRRVEVQCTSSRAAARQVSALAVDQSAEACRLTAENAMLNGVSARLEVRHLALTVEGLPGVDRNLFDMVVSNPPYVPSSDLDQLQPEILM